MLYTISNIKYDTDGEKLELPRTLKIEVDENLEPNEKIEYISDKISDLTGFCHFGFLVSPVINET